MIIKKYEKFNFTCFFLDINKHSFRFLILNQRLASVMIVVASHDSCIVLHKSYNYNQISNMLF